MTVTAAPGSEPDRATPLDRQDALAFVRVLTELLDDARQSLEGIDGSSATSRLIEHHLGCALSAAVVTGSDVPTWQHVSTQRAAEAYLAERKDPAEWHGVSSPHREHLDLMSLLRQESRTGATSIAPADYSSAPDGPDTHAEVIIFGLVRTHAPTGEPVVVGLHQSSRHGPPTLSVVVLAAAAAVGAATSTRLRELIDVHDVIRGQVVTFGQSEHYGNALVTFLPRPRLDAGDVILAPEVLPTIEKHLMATGKHADRLRRSGIHLKRGLLLYGPPGTGKTHTVRYLMSRAVGSTVVVLSGSSLQYIEMASALARRLAPTVVVVEDVDLIGQDRSFSPDGNPLLFTLLDAMDGVAADADVTFVLTTNRPGDLEEALVQRPGRIDLAVEIGLPDADGRRRLLQLYSGRAQVTADLTPAVEATAGMTASALKELMRRSVLAALERQDGADDVPPVVTADILHATVRRFVQDAETLQRALRPDDLVRQRR